jgi:hypothetical protein
VERQLSVQLLGREPDLATTEQVADDAAERQRITVPRLDEVEATLVTEPTSEGLT